jgi:hypothetical protein
MRGRIRRVSTTRGAGPYPALLIPGKRDAGAPEPVRRRRLAVTATPCFIAPAKDVGVDVLTSASLQQGYAVESTLVAAATHLENSSSLKAG